MILPGRRFGRKCSVLGARVNRPLRSRLSLRRFLRLPFRPHSLRTSLLLPPWLCRLLPKRFLSLCSRSSLHLSQRLHLSSLSPSRLHPSLHMSPWFRLGRLLLCSFFRLSSLHRPVPVSGGVIPKLWRVMWTSASLVLISVWTVRLSKSIALLSTITEAVNVLQRLRLLLTLFAVRLWLLQVGKKFLQPLLFPRSVCA